jgi:malate synthase
MEISGPKLPEYDRVLTPAALAFVEAIQREFGARRLELLQARAQRQRDFDGGAMPDFIASTRQVRDSDWKVADQPRDLQDRRVEITGPTDRKMVINALNSGASTFMADFEDANAPTWDNMVSGQANLMDAVRRTITFEQSGKRYRLNERTAVLIPRPRGCHLE